MCAICLIVAALLAGCNRQENTIRSLGGHAEPYHVDACLCLRAVFPEATDEILQRVAALDDVIELNLAGSAVSDKGLSFLVKMENLHILNLARTRLTDAGTEHLKRLGQVRAGPACIMSLILDDTAVTDAGVGVLAAMPNLGELSLARTKITDRSLCCLKSVTSLTRLNLDETAITDEGLAFLAGTQLRSLSLRDTGVTDLGVGSLHEMKELWRIDLQGTRVTRAGIREFEKAIPRIQIERDETTQRAKGSVDRSAW